jgi:magnesium-transporting ATPase (P-type)
MFISLILGPFTAFFELLFFALVNSKSPQSIQTSMFLFLSFVQLIVIVSIRNHDYFWKGKKPSLLLSSAMIAAFVVSLALPYIPIFARLFSFTPLPLSELAIIPALVLVYLFLLDLIKVWYFRAAEKVVSPPSHVQKSAQRVA